MAYTPKILIVDDELRMCDSLEFLLSSHGYEISTANSGKEALDLLSRERFDIAILDIVLPDINGHRLMEHISDQTPETTVIFITGYATLDSATEALRKGAYDYIKKPFGDDELLKTVENALSQKRLKYEKEIINSRLELLENRYSYLIQNSPDIIYLLDDQGSFKFINNTVERLTGYKVG